MRIFISYGRKDGGKLAAELAQWLRKQGYEPWLDVENGIPIGAPFDVRIEMGIAGSDTLVFLLSPWSLREGSFCRNELLFAQAKDVPIIPVRAADVIPPIQIISLNYIDACDDPEASFAQLPAIIEQVRETGPLPPREWPSTQPGGGWWAARPALSFEEELARHGGSFVGRDWLFTHIGEWMRQSSSRLLLLTGDAGVGKSAIAAQMTARLNVRGVHFCSLSNIESCRPAAWVTGLVYQLAAQFSAYRNQIDGSSAPNWGDPPASLFRTLIADPIRACQDRLGSDEPWVFVVDALDESAAGAGPDLAELLAESARRIPEWLRIVVTSRPDQALLARFRVKGVQRTHLGADDETNQEDLENYIAQRVEQMVAEGIIPARPDTVERLSELSAGNFQFAKMTLDALSDPDPQCRLSIEEVGALPPMLGGLYHEMFRKRFHDQQSYDRQVRPLLECLVAARGPAPEQLLLAATGLEPQTAHQGIGALSQFLSGSDAGLRVCHQSLADWLTDAGGSAEFLAVPRDGHQRLAEACWVEFERSPAEISDYAKAHMPTHLAEADRWDELLSVITSPSLRLIERWVDHADADQGIRCLTGLIEHGGLEPVHAAALATQVARIHSGRGEYDDAEQWLQYALDRTSWRRGRRTRAVALHEIGSLHLYRREIARATRAYRSALRLCNWGFPVYRDEAAANRIALATIAHREYRWSQVMRLAGRAVGEARSAGDFRHELAAERLMGMTLDDLGRYDEAKAKLDDTLAASRRLEAAVEEARLLVALGWYYYHQAHLAVQPPVEALEYFEEARDVARRIHNLYCVLDAERGMGWCALANASTQEAAECFEQIAAALPEQMHPELLGGSRLGMAAVTHQAGNLQEAEGLYRDAISAAEEQEFKQLAATGLVGLGATLWHTERRDEAEATWEHARQHAESVSPRAQRATEANIRLCKTGPDVPPR